MKKMVFTGVECDDRRIAGELQSMGYFDEQREDEKSVLAKAFEATGNFITWMRWKGEVNVYGCRVGADYARFVEAKYTA